MLQTPSWFKALLCMLSLCFFSSLIDALLAARRVRSHFLLRTCSPLPDVDLITCFSFLDCVFLVYLPFTSDPSFFVDFFPVCADQGCAWWVGVKSQLGRASHTGNVTSKLVTCKQRVGSYHFADGFTVVSVFVLTTFPSPTPKGCR